MKLNPFNSIKIIGILFLTFSFLGVQKTNAQFWKKEKEEVTKTSM